MTTLSYSIKMVILGLLLMSSELGYSQFVHLNAINNDFKTRTEVGKILAASTERIIALKNTNDKLRSAIEHHKKQLERNYTKNQYDKESNFFTQSLTSSSLSIASEMVTSYSGATKYLTNNKRSYMSELSMNKAVLLFLQRIDHRTIKTGDRQEVYRLRSELLRLYSKNDKITRKLMLLPAAAFAVEHNVALLQLLKTLEILL